MINKQSQIYKDIVKAEDDNNIKQFLSQYNPNYKDR